MVSDVAAFRRFNRSFTRRIGLLSDTYLGQDRPLGEARLLYEIGSGASLRDLRTRLGLDAGYLSRLVRSLADAGLVRVRTGDRDSRLRIVEPTAAGEAELAEQHRRADALVTGLLDGLTGDQRRRLIDAMGTAERLLRLAAITIGPADPESADGRRCLHAYAAELDARFPEGFDTADLVAPGEIRGDRGVLLLAREDGRAVGCGALRTFEPGIGEIRHVWLDRDVRGLGLGRRLLAELEGAALARGMSAVRLGTHPELSEAIQMYRTSGYSEIPHYGDDPHSGLWFEKRLG
ncbi:MULTISPECIES: bifunctional helix-turn-helix transcriptional regulator/GNAT family N-acetyltransferase [Amycolatopsis]|uniref:bifunctional helix-turn-helix transcriptional regulator/GNAT family N-acetyltransferase n=1 Tax=Amycolatopsis TaxID=1813 RepID=UPI000B8AF197|nr:MULTISPECIES: MarR family winged helix-turn-helix transcriptional regulator [Amycolatopsis]OXM71358.1 GNAT family N-acetyltransferase [Amycolatopsis sp. KNN50.9b]